MSVEVKVLNTPGLKTQLALCVLYYCYAAAPMCSSGDAEAAHTVASVKVKVLNRKLLCVRCSAVLPPLCSPGEAEAAHRQCGGQGAQRAQKREEVPGA